MALDREQFLLTKLAEEACEVAQMALKTQQFGLREIKQGETKNNFERLRDELVDLFTILELLDSEGFVTDLHNDNFDSDAAMKAKKERVQKYYLHSKILGKVE